MVSEFEVEVAAMAESAAPLRHALFAFLETLAVSPPLRLDIVTAVGEAVANAVEHAYRGQPVGSVRVSARMESTDVLAIEVADAGRFVQPSHRPERGFGLRIMASISQAVNVHTQDGTTVCMRFNLAR